MVLLSLSRKITDYIFRLKEKRHKTSFPSFQMLFNLIFNLYKIIVCSGISIFDCETNKTEYETIYKKSVWYIVK